MSTDTAASTNSVHLQGRVSAAPQERVLPSGDRIVTFRLIVPRLGAAQRIDVIECVAWTAKLRARVLRLNPDVEVDVDGELRRRFTRSGGGPSSFVSVDLAACSMVLDDRR